MCMMGIWRCVVSVRKMMSRWPVGVVVVVVAWYGVGMVKEGLWRRGC